MIDALNYFYNINISKIHNDKNNVEFRYQNNNYIFTKVDRQLQEIEEIYKLTIILLNSNIPCHEIVLNNNNKIISIVGKQAYILLKNNVNSNDRITINDIVSFTQKTIYNWDNSVINRNNWKELWINKIDAIEYKIKSLKKDDLYEFYYYQGIVENCIQLLNDINNSDLISISHKRVSYKMTYNEFYNPLNFIIDSTTRDIAEYLKSKLIIGIDINNEIEYLLSKANIYNFQKLFCRILFPSYQLDAFEEYNTNLNKDIINNKYYEIGIKKIYDLISSYIFLPNINWLHQ